MTLFPMFPSDAQAAQAERAMNGYLEACAKLKEHHVAQDSPKYHMVPKHHMCKHLAQNFKFLNPRYTGCFQSEDFVGKKSRLAHSCSFGVSKTKLSWKLLAKYRLMLHLVLHRVVPDMPDEGASDSVGSDM